MKCRTPQSFTNRLELTVEENLPRTDFVSIPAKHAEKPKI